jgi:hypothetical protein
MQALDLVRVKVRADLVQVRVVLEKRTLRNFVRVRDGNTSVSGPDDAGGAAVLASDTQADDLFGIRVSLGIQRRRGEVPHLANLEVATVRVDDPCIHSCELVAISYQRCAVSRRC